MTNWKQGEEGGGMLGRVGRAVRGLMRALAPGACTLMLGLTLLPVPCTGQGPVPLDILPFQGSLVNGDGSPLGTPTPKNYDVVFRIYDDPSSGTLLWSEQQTVTVDAGRYSVQLGQGGPVGTEPKPGLPTLFRSLTASDRYVETTVKGVGPGRADSTLLPRVRMLPSAYAVVSQYARTAERLLNGSSTGVISLVGSKVGINTTNPATGLEVAGNLRVGNTVVNGNVRAGGAATAASWTGAGAVPIGTVVMWSGSASERPAGWALCDGAVVNGLRTPDLRGRFVLGAGAAPGRTERRVGEVGGAEAVALSMAEVPSHSHFMDPDPQFTNLSGNHQHQIMTEAHTVRSGNQGFFFPFWGFGFHFWGSGNGVTRERAWLNTSSSGDHDHWVDLPAVESTTSGGGGQPHPNMPPFYVLAYIVRVQ
jgi:microcystin-dependent protein